MKENNPVHFSVGQIVLLLGLFVASVPTATFGATWHWRNPVPTANTLQSVAFGNGKFVAVGEVGEVLISDDGVQWDEQPMDTLGLINRVVFAGGQFVAVGDNGLIATSPDGFSWASQASGSTNSLTDIAFGNGRFVVNQSPTTRVLVSTNGTNWSQVDLGWVGSLYGVAW